MVESTEEKNLIIGFIQKEFVMKQASILPGIERSCTERQPDSGRSNAKLPARKEIGTAPMAEVVPAKNLM
jgi:hypothetical protein